MFRGQIESWVHDTAEASFRQWLSLVRAQVEDISNNSNDNSRRNSFSNNGSEQEHITTKVESGAVTPTLHRNIQHNHVEDEDEMSDFSGPPSIADHDLSDYDEEYEDEDEDLNVPGSSSDEQYFESTDTWQPSDAQYSEDLRNYMAALNSELNSMRRIIEVNQTRLLGLENSFARSQTSRPLALSNRVEPVVAAANSNNSNANANGEFMTTTTTTTTTSNDAKLTGYITKLEALVKQQKDDEQMSQQRHKEWEAKVSELESKLAAVKTSSKAMLWFNAFAFVFFLVGWPLIARKLWRFITPLIKQLMLKQS
ncbi:hypothetical protein SAMD00019534_014990 [Acytostelium subglobosum LB1]|uniref:hypothetical protein n=1 Tax=Acytostelium subglobosum LB1 TaxID=1410327 RepID=UPI0006447B6B|nr:hypothetical protein SAMD00019534_014990 [Acytostelium subglobosum LB1]GAM18324.1 hypothetical protein SAMD00019534_014990 [Acytostelium subglobosum LB1]|eukprot:XP_012757544.1 hypothetical protein SAMD00019534_014990 [Acytostelium subglobosum LB1]